ncbi:unnamed protein product [Gongylonema pulchrum]|uniref:BHLH domain-containing protein n=1 Tax=Gongylonema pulchrum TaxID=637853 RepID=A0A183ETW9_9BILA|nr:unnamed protein product [Gongylonema pulchrum]
MSWLIDVLIPGKASDDQTEGEGKAVGRSEACLRRGKGGARRYKTPSPQLLRMRRQAANARERRRMNNLNDAFDRVSAHLHAFHPRWAKRSDSVICWQMSIKTVTRLGVAR